VADWVRLHNTGGDSGNAIISMSLCKVLRLFGSGFLGGTSFFAVPDNPDE
jgi:hypothetical protein